MARKASSKTESTANLGFEQKLWLTVLHFENDRVLNDADAVLAESARLEAAIRANLKSLNFIT
jgi:hypothetical protein